MLTSSSIVSQPPQQSIGASLATDLFSISTHQHVFVGNENRIIPSGGYPVRCEHCARKAFSIIGDCIVINHRHDSSNHQTVVSLAELGLKRI